MKTSCLIACGVSAFISACGGGSDPTGIDVQEKVPPVPGPEFSIPFPAGVGCSFALLVEGTGGKRVINEQSPRIINAGKGSRLAFSRIDDSVSPPTVLESVTLDSNGSVTRTIVNPDNTESVVATGHNVFILFPTDVPRGPLTQLYIGRVEYTFNPESTELRILNSSGQIIDVCAMIAP